jgi:hypothetical protein
MSADLHLMLDLWHEKRAEGLSEAQIREFFLTLRQIDYDRTKDQYPQEFWDWAEAGFPGLDHDVEDEPYDEVAANEGAIWVY